MLNVSFDNVLKWLFKPLLAFALMTLFNKLLAYLYYSKPIIKF